MNKIIFLLTTAILVMLTPVFGGTDEDIYEALIEYLAENQQVESDSEMVLIEFDTYKPAKSFLNRFKGLSKRVESYESIINHSCDSDYKLPEHLLNWDNAPHYILEEADVGANGNAEVYVYTYSGLNKEGDLYFLRKGEAGWRVLEDEPGHSPLLANEIKGNDNDVYISVITAFSKIDINTEYFRNRGIWCTINDKPPIEEIMKPFEDSLPYIFSRADLGKYQRLIYINFNEEDEGIYENISRLKLNSIYWIDKTKALVDCSYGIGLKPISSESLTFIAENRNNSWFAEKAEHGALMERGVNEQVIFNIYEALFRYMFDNNPSGYTSRTSSKKVVFMIEINGFDSDDDLIKRFNGHRPVVKDSTSMDSSKGYLVDVESGKPAVYFHAGGIRYISDTEIEVDGGYYMNGTAASGNTYRLKQKRGKWVVVSDIMHWIS